MTSDDTAEFVPASIFTAFVELARAAGLNLFNGTLQWVQRQGVNQTCDSFEKENRALAVGVTNQWLNTPATYAELKAAILAGQPITLT